VTLPFEHRLRLFVSSTSVSAQAKCVRRRSSRSTLYQRNAQFGHLGALPGVTFPMYRGERLRPTCAST